MHHTAAVTLAPMPHFDALHTTPSADQFWAVVEIVGMPLIRSLSDADTGHGMSSFCEVDVYVPVSRPAMEYSTF